MYHALLDLFFSTKINYRACNHADNNSHSSTLCLKRDHIGFMACIPTFFFLFILKAEGASNLRNVGSVRFKLGYVLAWTCHCYSPTKLHPNTQTTTVSPTGLHPKAQT